LLALAFILVTIRQSWIRELEGWRVSGLANMRALEGETRKKLGEGWKKLSAGEELAQEIEVRLQRDEKGRWVLL
jgi:hypothetical protein